jgi:hypothetical protein
VCRARRVGSLPLPSVQFASRSFAITRTSFSKLMRSCRPALDVSKDSARDECLTRYASLEWFVASSLLSLPAPCTLPPPSSSTSPSLDTPYPTLSSPISHSSTTHRHLTMNTIVSTPAIIASIAHGSNFFDAVRSLLATTIYASQTFSRTHEMWALFGCHSLYVSLSLLPMIELM